MRGRETNGTEAWAQYESEKLWENYDYKIITIGISVLRNRDVFRWLGLDTICYCTAGWRMKSVLQLVQINWEVLVSVVATGRVLSAAIWPLQRSPGSTRAFPLSFSLKHSVGWLTFLILWASCPHSIGSLLSSMWQTYPNQRRQHGINRQNMLGMSWCEMQSCHLPILNLNILNNKSLFG